MPLPVCPDYSSDQLPVPAIPVTAVRGLPAYLVAAQRVFEEAAQHLPVPLSERLKVLLNKL
jgi:hypothetical protein